MKLTKIERNILFDKIVNTGIQPTHFYFENKKSVYKVTEFVDNLKVKKSNYFFTFDYFTTKSGFYYSVFYSPSLKDKKTVEVKPGISWAMTLSIFNKWIDKIKPELIEPDKWKEYQKRSDRIKIEFDGEDNSTFSYSEIQTIESSVNFLKHDLKTLKLKQYDVKLLSAKLDYLIEKSKTMGRTDWKGLFIGAILGTMMQLALPPETANSLWVLIGNALNTIFILTLNP